MEQGQLSGRRILVTGASSGIGLAIARACSDAGAVVVGLARRRDRLEMAAEEFRLHPLVADLSIPGEPERAIQEATAHLGGLDGLINNAAQYLVGGVEDGEVADWRTMFEVNVIGVLAAVKAALPQLRESRGDVVNVSSLGGHRLARPSTAAYAATKHALRAISEGLRRELIHDGIRVIMVSPGLVATELGAGIRDPSMLAMIRELQDEQGLDPAVVAQVVISALSLPHEATIRDVLVAPSVQEI